jgi:beta-fructofuranosidase
MALPIHWTIPYTRNCAGLALATSGDGGRTWEKSSLNPILDGEPDGLTVTGFRDPVLAEWPAMNAARGVSNGKGKLYGLVSGGVVGQGPNAFVYEVPAEDLTSWSYIGPLVNVPEGFQRPSHWTGDFGINWECVNFMTLADDVSGAEETQMLIMGTEGGLKRDVTLEDQDPHSVWAMWMGGSLKMTADGVRLEPEFTGFLDNGCFYAANSYEHPVSGKRIVWGWIKEEDLTLARRESKGWTGYLCLQRELFLFTANNVVGTIGTPLEDVPSFKVVEGDRGRTVQTLGIRPLQELQSLRKSHPLTWTNVSPGQSGHIVNARSTNWELEALIRVRPGDRKIGFDFGHNRDKSHKSRVYFSVTQEEIVVDRSMSNAEDDIQKDAHSGPFTLLVSEGDNGSETETLRLHIFRDGDVLEVFANDRFALSTVVYSDSRSCNGISWFVESEPAGTKTVFESISIWEGLQSIETSMSSHL